MAISIKIDQVLHCSDIKEQLLGGNYCRFSVHLIKKEEKKHLKN